MRALSVLCVPVCMLAACSDGSYTVVTVSSRPAVHGAAKLKVSLTNEGSTRSDDLDLAGHAFPVTFSISAPGRSGDLAIAIDAVDAQGTLVGRGSATTTVAVPDADLTLEPADFVVNTDVANDQFLTDDFEAVGLQLAAMGDGTWMAGYRDSPCTTCNVFGRRFDKTGIAVQSTVAANANGFPVTTTLTTSGAQAAVAGSGMNLMVFWDFTDTVGTAQGVACRSLDQSGNALPSQLSIGNDPTTDVVSAAALSNGNYAVTWNATLGTTPVIRTTVARPDCTTVIANPVTVSTTTGSFGARRAHVAANGPNVIYAWVVDSADVYLRLSNNAAGFTGATDTLLIPHTATQQVDHVRVSALGSGFAVAVRWSSTNGTGPGKLEVYRVSSTGTMMGGATLITDKSGSDFASDKAFGVATRADGALLVVWHQCDTGAGSCDVWGRLVRPTGVPVGDPFILATATQGDQVNPSAVALSDAFVTGWTDSSGGEPDHSGTAVRARIIYPPYDTASAVLGAPCGGSQAACGMGLACGMGSDGTQRCYQTCNPAMPPSCPAGGTCMAVTSGGSACTF